MLCNGDLRIDAMIALAGRLGDARLATGHYARIVDDGDGPLLAAAADSAKDQTYMLSGLRPGSLARLRFPLGELTKPEVREIASRAGLEVAGRAESQDLCFLAGQGKREFLRRHAGLDERPGDVVDRRGRRLGSHAGHHNFTVGQRRGLGRGRRGAALRARHRCRHQHGGRGPAERARHPEAPDPRRAPAPAARSAWTGSAFATTRPGATAAWS